MKHKKFSGECKCGHSFGIHHHGVIMRPEVMEKNGRGHMNIDGILGQECEHDQCNGQVFCDNPCECNEYDDVEW